MCNKFESEIQNFANAKFSLNSGEFGTVYPIQFEGYRLKAISKVG